MRVGAMNDPARPLAEEVARIAAAECEFIDLTLEPPQAWPPDLATVSRLLETHGLGVVGHTAPYVPHASPFAELREAAHAVLRAAFAAFAALGAELVNVHPSPLPSVFTREESVARNAASLASLADDAERAGLRLMVEMFGRSFTTVPELEPLFAASPSLGFHLDAGHANLGTPNRTPELVDRFGDRLVHVHVHDNDGVDDLHLGLGAGTVPWPEVVGALKRAGYDATVTIEVHDAATLPRSRELWLGWWNATGAAITASAGTPDRPSTSPDPASAT
jgi:sugar phosphate isomerase/epimerase